jgi:hypothetical protein
MVGARLVESEAADGSRLFDVVVDAADGSERVIYRGADRAHVEGVRADVESGRLDAFDVQQVLRDVILPRRGSPRPVFIRGIPIPQTWGGGGSLEARWTEAQRRIDALRAKAK